ncbi:molybdenum cofactor guanylyltransferase [Paenibacillus wulumuqiensis]|uniref:molybdenum cofactor guanylyltransferase n=1 Tax=Paenibacillus wulumuqiensis TaxID=1567107 RepID=UPI0006986844|nr:molybdenum cofactor guanylyltransferase [Paenibacillus wulumuqiensis]
MYKDTAGIILAGGQSRRMGTDKALLKIGERSVIERVAAALGSCVPQLCLAAAEDRSYDFLQLPTAPDRFPGQGPLSGLYAGMNALDAQWYVLSACDLPFASTRLLELLLQKAQSAADGLPVQAVLPTYQGRRHPLYAVYHHSVRPSLETALQKGQLRVMDWLNQHRTIELSLEQLLEQHSQQAKGDLSSWCLHNMNDPEAYKQALQQADSSRFLQ